MGLLSVRRAARFFLKLSHESLNIRYSIAVPWYFYIALKQLFPTGKRFHFFTIMSIVGIMLGVAILVIVQSVMSGFSHEIRNKIIDTSGHVIVESDGIIRDVDMVMSVIGSHPGVALATPYAHGLVMAQKDNVPVFPVLRTVALDPREEVIPVERYLLIGGFDLLDDDSVFLSSGLAMRMRATVGSTIEVYSPLMLDRLRRDEVLLPRELDVVGIFQTGWHHADENTMLGTRRLMDDLYGLGGMAHAVAIRLRDGYDPERVARELNAALPPMHFAKTWMDVDPDLLFVLQVEKNLLFFLLLSIIVVAAFSITSSMLMTVVRKTKEIGLLGALGGRSRQIAACFCFQGFLLGVVGTGFGVALGLVLLHFRNDIVTTFARITESEDALRRFYQFAEFPVYYDSIDFAVIIFFSIAISTMAGLIPAIRAACMSPTEAFRNE